jgi:NAD(P)-dependent dehydrogenase (short-subunit alcohol dehydrogenase family)
MLLDNMESDLFDLRGEIALVTGGLGQLGRQFVRVLNEAGATVVILDLHKDKIEDCLCLQVDITSRESVQSAYEVIGKQCGVPTILVNNAGVDAPPNAPAEMTGLFEDFPESVWNAVVDSHLKGALFVSQEFIRAVKKGGCDHSSIINVSSTYGLVSPDQSMYEFRRKEGGTFFKPVAYSVAKAGMLNFTRWLAEYGAPHNIRANSLVPGGSTMVKMKNFCANTIAGCLWVGWRVRLILMGRFCFWLLSELLDT